MGGDLPRQVAFDQEALELFQALLRVDTTNPPGNERPAAELLAEALRGDGLEPELFEKEPLRTNLVVRLKGAGTKPPLLLTAHLDVVPAEPESWSHPPFAAEIRDGWIFGRGAVDMKNMAAMSTMVLKRLAREKVALQRDVIFAAVADEEEGCELGSKFLVAEHPEKVRAELALGEVGGFILRFGDSRLYMVQVAHKGMVWLKARTRGTPGHGSIPREDQAIHKLALILGRLGRQKLPIHATAPVRAMIQGLQSAQPLLGRIGLGLTTVPALTDFVLSRLFPDKGLARTFNALLRNTAVATKVRAGYKLNVIPGEAEADLDCRTLPGQTIQDILRELRAVVGDEVDLEILGGIQALDMPLESPAIDAIRHAVAAMDPQGHVVPYVNPGFTDGAAFARLGIQFYGFVPTFFPEKPSVSFAELYHGNDERIPVEGFLQGLNCLTDIVRRLCC